MLMVTTSVAVPAPTRDGLREAALAPVGAVLGLLAEAVGRLRRARPLHPDGVVLRGRLRRHGWASSGVAWLDQPGDDEVLVRLSRAGGLPSELPDVQGLAVRHPDCDLLLASTGTAPVARHVLAPHRRVRGASFTSLLPFRGPHGPVLLAALPERRRTTCAEGTPLALPPAGAPARLRLSWATPSGQWQCFGSLEIEDVVAGGADVPVRLDPLRVPPGLRTYGWVAALRSPAYRRARRAVPLPSAASEE